MSINCIIKIELLSDMCVSDGSSYNSMIDTDICIDRFGFPYIPAKRLRGCLRECAIELKDWDDDICVKTLFGEEGKNIEGESSKRAKLRIGNAYLENYSEYRDFAIKNRGHILVHPQNVLSSYSYIRTQTSIDYKYGVADDKSLRTMRVADKGLVFEADAEVDNEDFFKQLDRCCKVLRHMGVARTRGLGEVKVSLLRTKEKLLKKEDLAELVEGADTLLYEIDLIEPVICKSINGGESRTMDYIEGAKILGLISGELNEDYLTFMDRGDLKCLNAYISREGIRYTEVPGYIYKIKNNKARYVNKLAETDGNREETKNLQLNQMKHTYAVINTSANTEDKPDKLQKLDVITEERYHHRRPDDKSIGRAAAREDGNADFYQMDSISEGQQFAGIVIGSPEQIAEVYRIMTQDKDFYVGYSRSSEYGRVRIRVTKTCVKKENRVESTRNVVICLNSPTIVYSENAMPTTSPDVLVEEILSALNIKERPKDVDRFIRNTTIGGYNVTWGRRKPTLLAFDKGTALHIKFDKDVIVPNGGVIMIGERTAEGYGEASISLVRGEMSYIGEIERKDDEPNSIIADASSEFASRIAKPLLDTFIRNKAVESAKELHLDGNIYRPTVSNMTLMARDAASIEDVREAVRQRYEDKIPKNKKHKGDAAREILKHVEENDNIIGEFMETMKISGMKADSEELKLRYLKEYLIQIKYQLRGGSVK